MRYSSRFFLYAPFVLLLGLGGFVVLHWWSLAGALEKKLAGVKAHEAVPGVTLDWAKVSISGFPFRLDAAFDGLSVTGQGAHGPFAWQAEKFAVHALTYGAQKDVFEAAGNQQLSWSDAAGQVHTLDFLPGSLRASAVRDRRGLARFDVDIAELSARNLRIGRAQFHMRRNGDAIDLMAEAERASGDLGVFGTELRLLRLYQTLSRGEAFAGLLRGEKTAPESHARWLLAGGQARITQSEFNSAKNALTPPQRDAAITLLSPFY